MNITIRFANKDEAERLSKIAIVSKKYWGYPKDWFALWGDILEITAEFIEKNRVWVAYTDNTIFGFIAISISVETAELEHMWILPEYINKGIGKKLLQHVLNDCRKRDITALRIESDPNAKGFYEKLGARKIGEVKSRPSPRVLPVMMIDILNLGAEG